MTPQPLVWLEGRVPQKHLEELLALLGGPDRHYHGIKHVEQLWRRHLTHGGDFGDDVIAYAVAYHDAVYDASRKDNEARSDDLWRRHSAEAGRPSDMVERVSEAIMATALHPFQGEAEPHVLWMVDLDLLGLANDAEEFEVDSAAVAREMPWVEPEAYKAGRKAFFSRMLEVPVLYRTTRLRDLYEAKARANLGAFVGLTGEAAPHAKTGGLRSGCCLNNIRYEV